MSLTSRFVFGHQRHHHALPVYGGPGGSERHSHLRRLPAPPQFSSARGQVDFSAGGDRAAGGRTPHRPGQHEESPFLWQLHQELHVAQDEADGGEAREGVRAAHPERVGGRPRPVPVPGAGV